MRSLGCALSRAAGQVGDGKVSEQGREGVVSSAVFGKGEGGEGVALIRTRQLYWIVGRTFNLCLRGAGTLCA